MKRVIRVNRGKPVAGRGEHNFSSIEVLFSLFLEGGGAGGNSKWMMMILK